MADEKELKALRTAIQQIETHRKDFHQTLEKEMIADSRLTKEQLANLSRVRFNHSDLEILSLVNQEGELPYKTLTDHVDFSQGMLSRYVSKLVKADLLTKVVLPDNKKAYNLKITTTGKTLAELHDQLHEKEREMYRNALSQFSDKKLKTTIAVLTAMGEVTLN